MKPLAKPRITDDEVLRAIDERIAEIVEKWQKQKLPEKKYKAFKIWKKYRPKKLRNERLDTRLDQVNHVNQRIAKMCQKSMYSSDQLF
jgi:hypothetical protein